MRVGRYLPSPLGAKCGEGLCPFKVVAWCMQTLCLTDPYYASLSSFIMVALCNRADHYIFILFLVFFFSFFFLSFFFLSFFFLFLA